MNNNQHCWPITREEYQTHMDETYDNPVQMTFNGFPVIVEYSNSRNQVFIIVSDEIENWHSQHKSYYVCSGDSAPINAFIHIFHKDPSLIYNNKKYTIEFLHTGEIDDVKNDFLYTPWRTVNSRWEAIQLDLWTGDSSDEQIREAEGIRSERLRHSGIEFIES